MPELKGDQIQRLLDAFIDAFASHSRLEQMVRIYLDEHLEAVAGGENLTEVVFELIVWAAREGRLQELMDAALDDNASNLELAEIIQQIQEELGPLEPGVPLELLDVPEEPKPIPRWLFYTAGGLLLLIAALVSWLLLRPPIVPAVTGPTATPIPTDTPVPTDTLVPSPTPTQTPTPAQMSGPLFNIAIADFAVLDEDGVAQASELGTNLSSLLFNGIHDFVIDRDILGDIPGVEPNDMVIWHLPKVKDSVHMTHPYIQGATDTERAEAARMIAERINAHLVLYGSLREAESPSSLELAFYYDSPQLREQPDTVGGRTQLAHPLVYDSTNVEDATFALKDPLRFRSKILFWLTVAMAHDIRGAEQDTFDLFKKAEEELADWRDDEGKELLYYLLGRSALHLRMYEEAETYFAQSLSLEPNYANALLGKGSIHFDRAQLFNAQNVELPPDVEACIDAEAVLADLAEMDADDAKDDANQAVSLFVLAIDASKNAVWPPIEGIAHLNLGLALSLQAQLEPNDQTATVKHEEAVVKMAQALPLFERYEQIELMGHTYLGLGTSQLALANRFARLKDQEAQIDAATKALTMLTQCIRLANDERTSLWMRQKIIECGCEPYREQAEKEIIEGGGAEG